MRTILKLKTPAFACCAACAVALLAARCNAPSGERAAAATTSSANVAANAATDDGLIPGTPPGDLGDWVRDIRTGIQGIPEQARVDGPGAQRVALELYVTRQEYAEMYYGLGGRLSADSVLAAAVVTAEERFHELLKLLGTPQPSSDDVQTAVAALDQQQSVVARRWQQSDRRVPRSSAQ